MDLTVREVVELLKAAPIGTGDHIHWELQISASGMACVRHYIHSSRSDIHGWNKEGYYPGASAYGPESILKLLQDKGKRV